MQYASLPTSQLESWALFNNVELNGVKIEPTVVDQAGNAKGGGLVSTAHHSQAEVLLIVPHDLIVSKPQITDCAKIDAKLRQLIDQLEGSDLTKVMSRLASPSSSLR
jgi:hypothetical protein